MSKLKLCDAIWVGVLDLDSERVQGITQPRICEYNNARLLVRLHGAAVGYVSLAVRPEETFETRARADALNTLSDSLRRHRECDALPGELHGGQNWAVRLACPLRHPDYGGEGLTVAVCTRDRAQTLRECLHALRKMTFGPLEFVIVDNAPSDSGTMDLVSAFSSSDPRFRYVKEPLPGLSRARNRALSEAQYGNVAFTDDDTLVDPGWADAIASAFASDPAIVCVTGLVASRSLDTGSERYFDARYQWGEAFDPRLYDLARHRHPSRLYPFRAGIFGTGANFAVRRDYIRHVGGFDVLLGAGSRARGGEDLDIFLRIILSGGRIAYLPPRWSGIGIALTLRP